MTGALMPRIALQCGNILFDAAISLLQLPIMECLEKTTQQQADSQSGRDQPKADDHIDHANTKSFVPGTSFRLTEVDCTNTS